MYVKYESMILTHFRPMLGLCKNQVVGVTGGRVMFYVNDLHRYLKCRSSTGVFQTFS